MQQAISVQNNGDIAIEHSEDNVAAAERIVEAALDSQDYMGDALARDFIASCLLNPDGSMNEEIIHQLPANALDDDSQLMQMLCTEAPELPGGNDYPAF